MYQQKDEGIFIFDHYAGHVYSIGFVWLNTKTEDGGYTAIVISNDPEVEAEDGPRYIVDHYNNLILNDEQLTHGGMDIRDVPRKYWDNLEKAIIQWATSLDPPHRLDGFLDAVPWGSAAPLD